MPALECRRKVHNLQPILDYATYPHAEYTQTSFCKEKSIQDRLQNTIPSPSPSFRQSFYGGSGIKESSDKGAGTATGMGTNSAAATPINKNITFASQQPPTIPFISYNMTSYDI